MKKFLTSVLAAAFILSGVFGCNGIARAEEDSSGTDSLRISPSGVRFTLEGGKVLVGDVAGCKTTFTDSCSVQMQNTGETSFRYKVYVTPYSVSGSNNELSFSENDNSTYTQISRWITIKNSDGEYVDEAIFSIGPGETQTVEYRIDVPESLPGGSQYAVLWAQILNDGVNTGGFQTVGQVGSVISGRAAGNSYETAEIKDVKMDRFVLGGSIKASATVQNTGNLDFVMTGSYVVKTFFGKEVYSKDMDWAAYPETDYYPEIEWENPPMLGIFQATFTLSAADQFVEETHVVIIMPLVVIILLILLLTIVIVWIIIIIRKRKERKARKLV